MAARCRPAWPTTKLRPNSKALLAEGDITVNLHEYGGFERVGSLPTSLTTSDTHINAVTGDIVLYVGDQIVFMLGANSWSYTPLGHIDADGATLESFFGTGNSTVTLSLSDSGVDAIEPGQDVAPVYYDLQGREIIGQPHGIVVKKIGNNISKIHKD